MIPKVLSRKTKYKGQWFDIVGMNVRLRTGKIAEWEMIKSKDAVGTIALDDKNNVYIGKEWKAAQEGYIYTIAAGEAEEQDSEKSLIEQARKELREEFGLNAKKFEKLATVVHAGRGNMKWHIYLARGLYKDPLEMEDGEYIKVMKLPINKALKLLLTNKSHFVALLGLLLVKEKLKL